VLRALTVLVALVVLASLPCLIAWLIVGLDEMAYRAARLRRATRRRRTPKGEDPLGPPIEQIAADLRRLAGTLASSASSWSALRYEATQHAYDQLLRAACRALVIEEHIDELSGVDREIERVRVEGELQAAGLVVRPSTRHGRER